MPTSVGAPLGSLHSGVKRNTGGIFCHFGEAAHSLALRSCKPAITVAPYVDNDTQVLALFRLVLCSNARAIFGVYFHRKKGKCVRINYACA